MHRFHSAILDFVEFRLHKFLHHASIEISEGCSLALFRECLKSRLIFDPSAYQRAGGLRAYLSLVAVLEVAYNRFSYEIKSFQSVLFLNFPGEAGITVPPPAVDLVLACQTSASTLVRS